MSARPQILVVDDEEMIRMLAVDLLDILDAEGVEAGTAEEALSVLSGHGAPFAAALVDLGLPDRPGEELVVDLRRLAPDMPIVVTSGQAAAEVRGNLNGVNDLHVLEKPYQLADLERMFQTLGLCPS